MGIQLWSSPWVHSFDLLEKVHSFDLVHGYIALILSMST